MKQTVTVYRSKPQRGWRWRIQARNRVIVGASSEAFVRLSRCLENLRQVTGITIWSDDYDKKFGEKARFLVTWDGYKSLKRFQRGQPVMIS